MRLINVLALAAAIALGSLTGCGGGEKDKKDAKPPVPAKDAPAKDAPAKDAPAKDAPAKDAPAKDAPAK